uniref:Uncharacterized protein n=1 Tax=Rhizophora mucronata TaxID=61149 RepID=A0A2P2PWS8_RHIMU
MHYVFFGLFVIFFLPKTKKNKVSKKFVIIEKHLNCFVFI